MAPITRIDRKPDGITSDRRPTADFETEPIAKVKGHRSSQFVLRHLPRDIAIEVDVETSTDADIPGEERGGTLDDPSIVNEVEPLDEAVISNLPLKLLQRPSTVFGCSLEPVRQGRRKGGRCRVSTPALISPPVWGQ